MKEITSLLREETTNRHLVEVDMEALNKIQKEVKEIIDLAPDDPQVKSAASDMLLLITKMRIIKAVEGVTCTKCYDLNLLKLISEAAEIIKLTLAGRLPLTHDLKIPVKALVNANLSALGINLNLPSKVKPGDLFYVDLHIAPILKLLGICDIVS